MQVAPARVEPGGTDEDGAGLLTKSQRSGKRQNRHTEREKLGGLPESEIWQG